MTEALYKERVEGEVVVDDEWLRGFMKRAMEFYYPKLEPSYIIPSDRVYAVCWWVANMGWMDRVVWRYMPFLSSFKF